MTLNRIDRDGLTLLTFPPSMLALYADVKSGSQVAPHNVDEAVAATHAEAALDGPMFEKCSSQSGVPYSSYNCGELLYKHYDLRSGLNVSSKYPSRGITISVLENGHSQAADGDVVPPNATVAVQLYPAMVVNGQTRHVSDADGNAQRAALAIMEDGNMAFVISRPMLMSQFAQKLVAAGAKYAGYTDGGGSTSLATPTGYKGSSEHRRVLTWLLAKAQQSTRAVTDVVMNSTQNITQAVREASPETLAAGAILLVAGGVGIWLLSRQGNQK